MSASPSSPSTSTSASPLSSEEAEAEAKAGASQPAERINSGKAKTGFKGGPTKSSTTTETKPSPPPLGWTQIKRTKKRPRANDPSTEETYAYCCGGPDCPRPNGPPAVGECKKVPSADDPTKDTSRSTRTMKGTAIFCLHELDPSWFQGQFVPSASRKPLGLLAVQRDDVDECLQCTDGGYRQLDVTVFNFEPKEKEVPRKQKRRELKFERVDCTGGDMLRFRWSSPSATNGTDLVFDADRIVTGRKAEPLVERYFPSLLRKIRSGEGETGGTQVGGVLDLLPDVAVVIGTMELTVPAQFAVRGSSDKVDDWMSD